jgi:glycosyltransferase involved in cell wall biosynthesis
MKISVCMASYNGAKYIGNQITSILHQLALGDELIIVDDASLDGTVSVIEGFADARIKLHINCENLGPTKTFEKALGLAEGDLVFLSDQDDIWYEHKVSAIRYQFEESNLDLIVHDARVINGDKVLGESLFQLCNSSPGLLRNLISNTHTGCCMVLRHSALAQLLPIPSKKGIFHDSWIGVLSSCLNQKKLFLNMPLIDYQRHDKNVSTMRRRNFKQILPERFNLIIALTIRMASRIIFRRK